MFQLAKDPTFTFPVIVHIPTASGGFTKHKFTGKFKHVPHTNIQELVDGVTDETSFLEEVFVGWDGVKDEDGEDLTFSEAARQKLLAISYVRTAVSKAYFDSLKGPGGRRGN